MSRVRSRVVVVACVVAVTALGVGADVGRASSGVEPDDPRFGEQWALRNTGQEVNGTTGTPGADIDATGAWELTTGSDDVVVAVLDAGIDATHPDLAANMWSNPGGVNGCPEGTTGYDTNLDICQPQPSPHGTAMAGVVGAVGDNATGGAGVAWQVRMMDVRWAAQPPTGGSVVLAAGGAQQLVDGIDWVIRARRDHGVNVRVINCSCGHGSASSAALRDKIAEAGQAGILFVAAAGNDEADVDEGPQYPCSYDVDSLLCVAATNSADELVTTSNSSWGSNWGPGAVDLAAPGEDVLTTRHEPLLPAGYRVASGTSLAAPHVAGVAALLWAHEPGLSVAEVRGRILTNVDVLDGLDGKVATAGRLNALGALTGPSGVETSEVRGIEAACPDGDVPSAGFSDVDSASVHAGAVDCVAWWDIGLGDGSRYRPRDPVSRAQMASFVARFVLRSGGELPSQPRDHFPDDDGSVHEAAINALAEAGIVLGRADGSYAPAVSVTRAQMATYLVRAVEYRTATTLADGPDRFPDDDGSVHEPAIDKAAHAGLVAGKADGTFDPSRPVARGQMASFLARGLDLLVTDGHTHPPSQTS